VSLATVRKTDRRAALELPFARDHDRSVSDNMERGVMPRTLDALVAWLMATAADETPPRLHRSGVWHDHGEHGEGGSALGSPALAAEFRRVLEDSPSRTDEDGCYLRPLRATISRLRRRQPLVAADAHNLVCMEGNWRLMAAFLHMDEGRARIYLGEALRIAWREFSVREVRLD